MSAGRTRSRVLNGPPSTYVNLPAGRGRGRTLLAKTCAGCGEFQDADEFPLTGRSHSPDPRCRACHRIRNQRRKVPKQKWRIQHLVAKTCQSCDHLRDADEFRVGRPNRPFAPYCSACRRRMSEPHSKDVKQRAQRATLAAATRYGAQWTGPELELLARPDLTIKEIAFMVGRSHAAVRTKRNKMKTDPRLINMAGVRE